MVSNWTGYNTPTPKKTTTATNFNSVQLASSQKLPPAELNGPTLPCVYEDNGISQGR